MLYNLYSEILASIYLIESLVSYMNEKISVVIPVYNKLRLSNCFGPPKSGMITAGYSLPCAL